ncbi:MAG: hypothetical protein DCO96_02665 [Fluviicola sp. XM-24bin1]|nr:MAG: hypothetical protein DCO96_02665 [Fluviicola sp. XM-24bin1]
MLRDLCLFAVANIRWASIKYPVNFIKKRMRVMNSIYPKNKFRKTKKPVAEVLEAPVFNVV